MKYFCAAFCGTLTIVGSAAAETLRAPGPRPVVVEMFLSQSCKSSPPAGELARRPDVVALGYHVPYWNEVPSHAHGVWADPFSRPEFAERQRLYNMRMRRSDMVYTPQAVVDGVFYAVGSKRDMLDARITEAQFLDEHARPTPASIAVTSADGGMFRIRIDGVGAPYDAYAVSFRPQAVTEVEGGDNAGSTFDEINVVTGVKLLSSEASGPQSLAFEGPPAGEDCAILVQEHGQGRIVAARYCSDR